MCVSEWRIAEGFFLVICNDDLCESTHNKCKEAVRETPTFHRIIGRHVKSSASVVVRCSRPSPCG